MEELSDPTLTQGYCTRCGLPVRSDTFRTLPNIGRMEIKTAGGVQTRAVDLGEEATFNANQRKWRHEILPHYGRWETDPHDDGDEYVIEPHDNRTHEQDYERQHRNWQGQQLEKLGKQFDEMLGRD